MVVYFALCKNIKVIPLDVVSSGFDVVSNDRAIIIFSEGLRVFGFPTMKLSFSFTNVKTFTVPAICSVNNFGLLRPINAVLGSKERFYASSTHDSRHFATWLLCKPE